MIGIPPNVELPSHSSEREAPRRHHEFHQQIEKNNLTRRQFLKVGVALFGTAAGGAMLRQPAFAAAPGTGVPKQIPGFSPILFGFFGVEIPFFLPVETDPFMVGPEAAATSTTIWDFNGRVGVVEADGVSDNNSEGVPRRWACDVRFQKGVFVDRQGRTQRGAFGFF